MRKLISYSKIYLNLYRKKFSIYLLISLLLLNLSRDYLHLFILFFTLKLTIEFFFYFSYHFNKPIKKDKHCYLLINFNYDIYYTPTFFSFLTL